MCRRAPELAPLGALGRTSVNEIVHAGFPSVRA